MRFARAFGAIATLLIVTPVCTDLTGPAGLTGTVTLTYMGPPTISSSKTAVVTVGDSLTPIVQIAIGGLAQPRAQYAIRSIQGASSKVKIFNNGVTFRVDDRGVDTLIIALVGTTVDSASAAKTQDSLFITAIPASNIIGPGPLTLASVGDTATLFAVSKKKNGEVIGGGDVQWSSTDPTVATVSTPTIVGDTSKIFVTAIKNGSAQVQAIFDGTVTVLSNVTIAQRLHHYVFTASGNSTGLGFSALGETSTLTAEARDAQNVPLAPQPAAPTFVSSKATVTVDSHGLLTAIDNSAATDSARISVVGWSGTEYFPVFVQQIAATVTIGGLPTVPISAPFVDTLLQAFVRDKNGNSVRIGTDVWRAENEQIAVVTNGTVSSRSVGTTKIFAKHDTAETFVTVVVSNIPDTLDLAPNPMAIRSVGDTVRAVASVKNRKGQAIPPGTLSFNWVSLNPSIATVDAAGLVTAIAVGNTSIIGTTVSGGAADTVAVVVTNAPDFIDIIPTSVTLASINDTLANFPVDFRNSKGTALPRNSVKWTSEDPTIARVTIDGTGTVIAVKRGEVRIIAENADGSKKDTLNVTVTNAPNLITLNRTNDTLTAPSQTLSYTADIVNARGALIPGDPITWRSTNPAIATVNSAGLATALAVGQTLIIGETGAGTFASGLRGDTAVLVVINSATAMAVSPGSASITSVGSTQQLSATATNIVGGNVAGLTFVWTSADPLVATVSPTGLVTAVGPGSTAITAAVGALSSSSTITVTNLPSTVDFLSLTDTTMASVGDSFTPAITLKNAVGSTLPRAAAVWTSDDPLIAKTTSDGVITAVSAGTTKIRAANSNNAAISDFFNVTVTNAPAFIALSRVNDTLPSLGRSITYTATVRNARGDVIVGATVNWLSRAPGVASVNAGTGVATAVGSGTTFILGTAGTIVDSAKVLVSNFAASVAPVPTPMSLTSIGQTQQIAVTVRNEQGNLIATPVVTYGTANAAVATVSGTGLVTATGVGTTTITVTSDAVSVPVTVAVANAPTSVDIVSPDTTVTSIGDSYSPAVLFSNATNPSLARDAVTWSTSNQLVAVVSSTGSVVAVKRGTAYIRAISPANALIGDSILVTVSDAPATIAITPAGPTAVGALGTTIQFTAVVRNARGDVIASPFPAVTWSSNNVAVSVNSSTGLATADTIGTAVITATAGAATLTSTVNVAQVASAAQSVIQTSSASLTADGSTTATITVRARDANGRNLRTAGTTATIQLAGAGAGNGQLAVTAVNDSTFTATVPAQTRASNATISATINGASVGSGNPLINYVPNAATKYLVTSDNVSPVAGTQVTITAELKDVNNNSVATAGKTITWSSTGGGTFTSPTSLTDPNGVATVAFTTDNAVSSYVVKATDNTALIGSTSAFVSTAATATHYTVTASTTTPAAGAPVVVTAQLTDAGGNLVATSGRVVTWSKSDANGSFSSPTSLTDNTGRAQVTFTSHTVAATTTTVTANDGSFSGTSGSIATLPGLETQLTITTPAPATTKSDSTFTPPPVIQLRDANGNAVSHQNVDITASIPSGSGTLSGATAKTNASGAATFSALKVAGTTGARTITFSSSGLPSVTSGTTVVSGDATQLTVTQAPTASPQNDIVFPTQPTVQLRDGQGNAVAAAANITASAPGIGGTVTVATNPATGLATFTDLEITGLIGARTITYSSGTLATATSSVTVVAGAATKLAIATQPSATANAGLAFTAQPVIQVQDNQGNVVLTDNSTIVTAARNAGTGVLQGALTATAVNGVATFTNLHHDVAPTTITVTFTAGGLTIATSGNVVVSAGTPTNLTVTTDPTTTPSSGVAFPAQPVIQLRDAQGNAVSQADVDVTAVMTSGTGTLGGTTTVQTDAGGVATFTDLTITGTTGVRTITFRSSPLTSVSRNVTVGAGSASQLTIGQSPSPSPRSDSVFTLQPTVQLRDAQGNTITTSGVSITVAMTSGTGTLSSIDGLTATTVNGLATFTNLKITGAVGAKTLTFTSGSFTSTTANVTLVAGDARKLGIATQPGGAVAGVAFTTQPVIQIRDAQDNVVLTDNSTVVTAALFSGTGALQGTLTATAASGVATFTNLQHNTAETITVRFTSGALTNVTSVPFSVTTAAATALTVETAPPANPKSDSTFTATVQLRDALTNLVNSINVSVTATITSGNGTLGGTTTVQTDASGLATFSNLKITGLVGARTITFSASGLTSATSSVTVVAGDAAQLTVTQAPTSSPQNDIAFPAQPTIQLRDGQGNAVAAAANITASSPGIGGTVTVATNPATGLATFTNLKITGLIGARTITYSSGTLTTTTSSVTVVAGTATKLGIATQPSATASAGVVFAAQPVIQVQDNQGNVVLTDNSTVVTAARNAGSGVLQGTLTATASAGVATFTNLGHNVSGTTITINFTAGGLATATSNNVVIAAGTATNLTVTTAPTASPQSGIAFPAQPAIQLRDALGNPVSQINVNVTATMTGGGALGGTTLVQTDASGVATFTDLAITGTIGARTLTFSASGLTSATSGVTLVAGTASQLVVTTAPTASPQNGVVFATQPAVQIRDGAGNAVTANGVNITAALTSGSGALTSSTSLTAATAGGTGTATFVGLKITGATGAKTLTFSSAGLPSVTSNVTLVSGAATQLTVTTSPTASPQNRIAFPAQPAIQLRDADGNTVATAGVVVTAAITAGGGTLGGTLTATTDAAGLATFTNLKITGTIGARTLTFSAPSATDATAGVTLVAGTSTQTVIGTQPSTTATAGGAFAQQPVVQIEDADGNVAITDNTTLITASRATGTAALQGTLTATAVAGVATFTNLTYNKAEALTIGFAASGVTGATSGTVTVAAGAAASLSISTQPSGAVAGATFTTQPAVQILDAFGNLRSTDNSTVVTASRLAGSGTLGGTITATASSGVATFVTLQHDVIGSITIQFTSGSLTAATSNALAVTSGTATQLTVTTSPSSNPQSGIAFTAQPAIQLRDAQGNVVKTAGTTVTAAITAGGGTLGGTTTAATDVNGLATFTNLSITGAVGARTLTFTASGVTSATSSVTLVAGTLADFLVEQSGGGAIGTQTAGTTFNLRITARDAAGNTVTSFSGAGKTVDISGTGSPTITAGGGTTATFTNGVLSAHAVTITNTGSFAIVATNTGNAETGTSNTFSVTAGVATALAIQQQPSASATAGSVFAQQPIVRIRDANGNLVTSDNTTVVTATAIGGTGSLLGTTTATATSGVATFATLKYNVAEAITVRFTTSSPVLTQATSGTVTVSTSTASQLTVTQAPSASPRSGVAFVQQPTIQLRDAQGNAVATAGVNVTAAITSGAGALTGTTTVATDIAGLATFTNLVVTGTAGAQTLTFTSGVLTVATADVSLVAGTANALSVTTSPTSSPQNAIAFPVQPAIQLLDGNGNPVSTAGVVVTAAITAGGGTLGGTVTAATNPSGLATFTNLAITGTIGARTLTYTSPGVSSTTSSVTLVAGTATQLVAGTAPSATATAGVAFATQPTVQIEDVSGNVVLTDNTTLVTAARAAGTGTLQGTVTATAVAGVATFTNLFHTAVSTITINFTAGGLTSATSSSVVVSAGAAASLAIETQPSATATSGAVFAQQPVIQILDAFGNVRAGDNSTVITASRLAGSGTLGGTITATASSGVATFATLQHDVIGSITVQFTSGSLTPATSNAIVVSAGTATQLTVTTSPSANPQSGIAFGTQPSIQLRDAQGNVVKTAGTTVTAAITAGGGTLGGTVTAVTDVNGLATFTNLSISGAIGARTLTFSASAVTDATSSVTLVAGTLADFLVEQSGGGAVGTQAAGSAFNLRITARDAAGNTVTSFSGVGKTVDITGTGSPTIAVGGGTTATFTNGVLSAHAVTVTNTGSFTLVATRTGNAETGASNTFAVSAGTATALAIQQQPLGTSTAGSTFAQQPIVRIRDVNGNVVTSDNTTVVTATRLGGSGTLLGTTTATAVNGVATFATLRHDIATTITIQFTTSSPVLTPVTSGNVVVSPSAVSQLTVTQSPSSTPRTGDVFAQQPTIQLRDAQGNAVPTIGTSVSVVITSGAGALTGTTTAATDAAGLATFTNLKITGASGARTLTFTSAGLASATASVSVVAGDANALSVTTAPSLNPQNAIAFPVQPAIQLRDADGNAVASPGTVVTAAITSGGGVLGGTLTATTDASGLATFSNLKITGTVGARTLTFSAPSVADATANVTLIAGAATQLVAGTAPSGTATAGIAFAQQPTVQIEDVSGNVVLTDNTTLVTASRAAGAGTLQGSLTASAVAGVATFTNLVHTVVSTITIDFTASGLSTATSSSVVVSAGAAASLAIQTQPSATATSGTQIAQQPVIQVLDAFGNVRGGDNSTIVTASRLAGTGALSGTITATASSGIATFADLEHDVLGSLTIQFTSGSLTPATSNAIVVSAGAATQLTVTTAPSANPQSGVAFSTQPAIQLRDAQGNLKATGGVTVTAAISTGGGTLGGTVTAVTNAGGLATFTNLSISGAIGARGLTFSAPSVTDATSSVTLVAGDLANFLVEQTGGGAIGTQTAGTSFNLRITARDAAGNTVTSFSGAGKTVDITGTGSPTFTSGNGTTATFTNGVLSAHAVTITNTGTFAIVATNTSGAETGTSNTFALTAGTATALAIQQQPSGTATAGSAFAQQPIVQLRDANGNVLTTDNSTVVTAARLAGTGTLVGTTTATAVAGVATFTDLQYNTAETITIRFTSGAIAGATSGNVVVSANTTADAATTLITASPTSITADGATTSTITVQAKDAFGNNLTASGGLVTLSTTAGTFTGAVVDNANGTYTRTLQSSTTAATATITGTIAATPITDNAIVAFVAGTATVAQSTIAVTSNSVAVGTAVTVTVQLKDANSNNLTTGGATVLISRSGTGALTTTADNGNGTYTATLSSSSVGSAIVSATIAGTPITSGNQTIAFTAGAATQIAANGGDAQTAAAGTAVATKPSVVVRDANGNPVSGVSVTFAIGLGGGSVTGGGVSTGSDGIATVGDWTLGATTGSNTLTATSGSLTGSPVTFTATGTVGSASLTQSLVETVDAARAAGQTTTITVTLRDAHTNVLTTSAGTVALATNLGTLSAVTNNNNGTYSATYTATTAGVATISATLNGAALSDDATITVSAGSASAATTTILAAPTSVAADGAATSTITVQAKDAAGNNLTTGGATVTLTLVGAGTLTGTTTSTTVTAIDGLNGTYTATLDASTVAGAVTISGTINAASITSGNATVTRTAGVANLSHSTISLSPVSGSSVAVGTPVTVTVQLKDVNDNTTTDAGAVIVAVAGVGTISGTTNLGTGHYQATLQSTLAGGSTITATLGGSPITGGGSQTITFISGAATQLAVNVGNNQSAAAGTPVPTPPSVIARDANGNPVAGVSVDFAITAGGGTISPSSVATVATGSDGLATLTSWTLGATAGLNNNTLTATATGLAGSPITFTATGTVGGASLTQSLVETTDATRAAGQTTTITVTLRDAHTNVLTTSAGTVALTTNLGTLSAVTNNNNGTYSATYTATTAGVATISATLNGAALSDDATITVSAGTASAATTTILAAPTSVAADGSATSTITVQAKDAAGNNLTTGGATVTLTLVGAGTLTGTTTSTTVTAIDGLNGTYTATLDASTVAGAVTISGTINAAPITSGNATVTRTAGTATTAQSTITLAPVSGSSITVGTPVTVTVQLLDANGNATTALTPVVIGRTGVGSITGTTNLGGGQYTATLQSTASGAVTVTATLNGSPITGGGAQTITFIPGTETQIALFAGDNQTATAGTAVTLPPSVIVVDANGNPVSGVSVDFTTGIGGGSISPASVATITTGINGRATLTSWTLGATAGLNNNTVTATATGLAGSPVTFTATGTVGSASLTQSLVETTDATRAAGQTTTITVTLRDANTNALTTSAGTVALTTNIGTLSAVTNNNNGTYSATFTATTAGVATISATLNGAALSDDATITVSAGTASAATTTILAAPTSVAADGATTSTITVQAKDAAGNNLTTGGATVTLTLVGAGTLTGTTISTTVTPIDGGTGTYTATLDASTVAGAVTISGMINAAPITSGNATVTRTAGVANLSHSTISLSPVSGSSVAVGTPVTATVQLKDVNDNTTTDAGAVIVAVAGVGTVSGTTNLGTGHYQATLQSTLAGGSTITATLGGSAITGGGSQTITFVAGSATTVSVNAGSGQSAVAGTNVATAPSVVVRDANGNPIANIPIKFTVTAGGGTTSPVTGTDVRTNSSGIAALTSWTLGNTVGANTVRAAVDSAGLVLTGDPIDFNATGTVGAASLTQSTITENSGGTLTAGATSTVTVTLKDAHDNALTTSGGAVLLSANIGSLSAVVNNSNGTYNATYTATTAGAVTVSGTLDGQALTSTATLTISTGANSATTSTVERMTSDTVRADGTTSTTIRVTLRDALGNALSGKSVTLAATSGAAVASAPTATNGSGQADFSVTSTVAYTATFQATNTTDAVTVTQTATVVFGASRFAIAGSGSQVAGASQNLTVEARDNAGNFAASFNGDHTVQFGGAADAPSSAHATALDFGGHSQNIGSNTTLHFINGVSNLTATTLVKVESATLTVNEPSTSLTSNGVIDGNLTVNVTAGATHTLSSNSATTQSATVATTVAAPPSVKLLDQFQNPVSGQAITFTVTAAATGGVTVPTSGNTVTTDASGIATLTSWTLGNVAGTNNNTVQASLAGATGSPVTFTASGQPDLLDSFLVTSTGGGAIGLQTAGTPFNIKVTALDQFGNTQTSFVGTVDLTATGASLVGTPVTSGTFVAGVLASQPVTFSTTGSTTITATDIATTKTGTSASFTVQPGALDHFSVTDNAGNPLGSQVAGTPFTIRIKAFDANGNLKTNFSGTADITSTSVITGAPFTTGAFASGERTETITLETAGAAQTITATNGGAIGTSAAFTIDPGALDHFDLVLATPQSNGVAFTSTNTLTAKDAFGNTVTTFDASGDVVTFAHDGLGTITGLSGTNALNSNTDFSGGVANLTLSLTYTNGSIAPTGEDVHFSVSSVSGKVSGSILVHIAQ